MLRVGSDVTSCDVSNESNRVKNSNSTVEKLGGWPDLGELNKF